MKLSSLQFLKSTRFHKPVPLGFHQDIRMFPYVSLSFHRLRCRADSPRSPRKVEYVPEASCYHYRQSKNEENLKAQPLKSFKEKQPEVGLEDQQMR